MRKQLLFTTIIAAFMLCACTKENKTVANDMNSATIKDLMNNPDFDVESTEEIRKDTIAEIMNKSYNVTCKKCGKEVCSRSTEIIKLPENYTEGAPKINEYMQKELDDLLSYSVGTEFLECGFHPSDSCGMGR